MQEDEWNEKLAELLSQAVNLEHRGFLFYQAAGAHFDSPQVGLLNIRDFFYKESDEEVKHARIVIKHMNERGLKLALLPATTDISDSIPAPLTVEEIFRKSQELEQAVLDHYLKIQEEADKAGDYVTGQFADYFLDMQTREVKAFGDKRRHAERCKDPLGEFIFDQSFAKRK